MKPDLGPVIGATEPQEKFYRAYPVENDRGVLRLLGAIGIAVLLALGAFYLFLVLSLPTLIEKRDPRCDGPARYEAMREAYEAGKPQPC